MTDYLSIFRTQICLAPPGTPWAPTTPPTCQHPPPQPERWADHHPMNRNHPHAKQKQHPPPQHWYLSYYWKFHQNLENMPWTFFGTFWMFLVVILIYKKLLHVAVLRFFFIVIIQKIISVACLWDEKILQKIYIYSWINVFKISIFNVCFSFLF